jgi:hypothetical protein
MSRLSELARRKRASERFVRPLRTYLRPFADSIEPKAGLDDSVALMMFSRAYSQVIGTAVTSKG